MYATPSQPTLDSSYGYIYRITNLLTGYQYIGKHKHTRGENWRDYMGSAFRLGNDQDYFGKEFFMKELIEWTTDEIDALVKEAKHMKELVESGIPHYNFSNFDGLLAASNQEQIQFMTAHRISFEPWQKQKEQRHLYKSILATKPENPEMFERHLKTVELAMEIFVTRVKLKKAIDSGEITVESVAPKKAVEPDLETIEDPWELIDQAVRRRREEWAAMSPQEQAAAKKREQESRKRLAPLF